VSVAPGVIAVALFLFGAGTPALAHREDYIDETLVFVTLDQSEFEPEYWFDTGNDGIQGFTRHHVALEYGLTDHWMIDGRATAIDENPRGFRFDSSRLETRYRFGDEGTLPIDIAVSGELNTFKNRQGNTRLGVEPRLVLSKDLGELNLTVNLAEEIPVDGPQASFEVRGGLRYDANDLVRLGAELHYDTAERSTTAVPQVWLTLPHDVTLKGGYSYDFNKPHLQFVRLTVEVGL
jgi:hypothetical protein